MKKFLALVLIGLGSAGALISWLGLTNPNETENKVEVWFNKNFSLADLERVRLQLKAVGVELTYKQVQFTEGGFLHILEFVVKTDNTLGSINRVVKNNFEENPDWGFSFDLNSKAPQPFYLGNKPV
jgi:hypothetical protein